MPIQNAPGLAPTIGAPGFGLLQWRTTPIPGTIQLAQTRAAVTYATTMPTLGAEMLEFLVENMSGASVKVVMLVRFGMDDTDVGANMYPWCDFLRGALALGLQRATLNEIELEIPALSRRRVPVAQSHHYFTVGLYTDAAPGAGQIVTVAVDRRSSPQANGPGV